MATAAELALRITADIAQFERAATTVGSKVTKLGDQVQAAGRNMSAAFTLPIATGFGAAGKEFMGLETTLAQMQGLAGVAATEIGGITQAIEDLAKETGRGPQELAKGLYFIRSSGLAGQEALDVLAMSAKASAAGLGETQVIADMLTSALNAYGTENLSAAQATDILVAAVREGKGEAWALAGSLGQVMPIAAEMGVQFDQVAASVAAMTRTGTNAETASMELKNILSALLKPSSEAQTALAGMGTSAAELRKTIREDGLLQALMDIRELTNKYGEDAIASVFPNIRALTGVLDLMGKNVEDNKAIFAALADATGATQSAFDKMSETAQFKWNVAVNDLNIALAKLGDTVMDNVGPAVEWGGQKLEVFAAWWGRLDEETKNFIVRAGLVVAAVGPVLLVIGALTKGVGGAIDMVGRFSGGIGDLIGWFKKTPDHVSKLGGVIKNVFHAATSPVGLALLAIGAIIAIGVLLVKNWETIKAKAGEIWEKVKQVIAAPINAIVGFIQNVIDWAEHGIKKLLEFLGIDEEAQERAEAASRSYGAGGKTSSPTESGLDYDTGGTVPGPLGAPRLAVVHGGEVIRTPAQERALGTASATPQIREIIVNATYYVTDRSTSEWANTDLLRKLRSVNLGV